jgi:protease-4
MSSGNSSPVGPTSGAGGNPVGGNPVGGNPVGGMPSGGPMSSGQMSAGPMPAGVYPPGYPVGYTGGLPASPSSALPAGLGPGTPIVIQTQGTFQRILGWVGWAGFFLCTVLLFGFVTTYYEYFNTTEGITEKYHSGARFGADKIAIIDVSGVIMEGDGFVKRQIDMVREDKSVKAVVVRVDSPGGTVTGSDYILHHLNKLRKERELKLVVSMGSIAASGGYYVSMAVGDEPQSIYAEPTTTTGSIGVIVPHYDVSDLLKRFDVRDDSIASHPRKQMLSMTRRLSDEDRKIVEAYVNESFERFKSIVKDGRPAFRANESPLIEAATGEIFTANQAKKRGLVDEIGFIEDALARVAELAGLKLEETRVVHYHRPPSLFDLPVLASAAGPRRPQNSLAAILELNAPRAWYLAASWPISPELLSWAGRE